MTGTNETGLANDADTNPYQSPGEANNSELHPGQLSTAGQKRVYCYVELPRSCPRCARKFGEIAYKKMYPRRFRKRTMAYFVMMCVLGLASMGIISWAGWVVMFLLIVPGTKFHKVTRVYCPECDWSQKYVVRREGWIKPN